MTEETRSEMNGPGRAQLANAVLQTYLELGDVIRLAALPNWITAELNISQLKAIVLLEQRGALTVSELAALLGAGKPAASILVQQLVEQGFAGRTEDTRDRRRTFVRLTERGKGLLASRREQTRIYLSRWLGKMDEGDMECLRRGLVALVQIAEKEKEGVEAPANPSIEG